MRVLLVIVLTAALAGPAAADAQLDPDELAALPDDGARDAARTLQGAIHREDAAALLGLVGRGSLRIFGRAVGPKALARRLGTTSVSQLIGLSPVRRWTLETPRKGEILIHDQGSGNLPAAVLSRRGGAWRLTALRSIDVEGMPRAVVLVIDRSGSMQGAKLEVAKEAARAAAESLDSADLFAVIVFDAQPFTLVRLQRASNRIRISSDISRLQAGGGTDVRAALVEAWQMLSAIALKDKHVVVLSDGQSPSAGLADLVDEMRAARITVSAVAVGDEADREQLKLIAEHGDGRLYVASELDEIPKLMLRGVTGK